jgi:hypothetical protein
MVSKFFPVDKVICLVLDEREQQRHRIAGEWSKKGISVEFFIVGNGCNTDLTYDYVDEPHLPPIYSNSIQYPTWHKRPSVYNAWKSHKKMMERCLESNGETFLFLEDDSFIEEDFDEIWSKTHNFFSANKWDAIYLGCYHNNNGGIPSYTKTNNEHILKLRGSGGLHGVIFKRSIIQNLVNMLPLGPFDWTFGQQHSIYNVYTVHPCIVSQLSGWSFIEGQFLEKPERGTLL